ncbi:hypothetical protein LTR74_012878 [Friedmanniomyces endolithicus]|nr:hypothetical protein LTR74_012878 [Friedmanniomyces endolithicus]
MAIGETIDAESLGGSSVHGSLTGLADHVAANEFEAIHEAREWVCKLPEQAPPISRISSTSGRPPRFPADDLLDLVNPDIRKPLPMHEVIARLVDDSHFSAFKHSYGPNLITGYADIHGFPVGIIANATPVINSEEAAKGTQFIRLCNQQAPIIFLHNVTGFMVGSAAEHAGIIKRGAQMVSAVSVSKVPHISIIIGASYGAGNYAMCGRSYKPRFMFTWPSGRCSVMGPDQLSGVMDIVEGNKSKESPELIKRAAERKEKLKQSVERDSVCYRTSAALLDDGVIDPRDTRDVLGVCLEAVCSQPIEGASSHRGLARM